MNLYLADPHLGHDNIRKHSHRPFNTVKEMDAAIIADWNSRVTDNDDVYIVGDFSYKGGNPACYLKQLKGRKHLIVGNHDKKNIETCGQYFVEIRDILEVVDNGIHIVLCHYPLVEWNGYFRGSYHFYGHVHNNFDNPTAAYARNMERAYNVGVDIIGFGPRTFKEIVGLK